MRSATFILVCLGVLPPFTAARAEPITLRDGAGWANDSIQAGTWQPRPDWLPNPDPTARVGVEGQFTCFEVSSPGKGMKWVRSIPPIDVGQNPYLFLRYRAENVLNRGDDYLVFADDGIAARQCSPVRFQDVASDGQWHSISVDMRVLTSAPTITAVAIQVQAAGPGPARLWVDQMGFVETPPPEFTLLRAPATRTTRPDVAINLSANTWRAEPSWLGNPAERHSVSPATGNGPLVFRVEQAGRGMKWQYRFAAPVSLAGHRFLVLRYRATNLAGYGDYALCLLGRKSGSAAGYEEVIRGTDLRADGLWQSISVDLHSAAAAMPLVDGLAIQVQAARGQGELAVETLRLVGTRPISRLDELIDLKSEADFSGFLPIDMSKTCNQSLPPVMRSLNITGWPDTSQITANGVPFRLIGNTLSLAATAVAEKTELTIPVGRRTQQVFLLMMAIYRGRDDDVWGGGPLRRITDVDRFRLRLAYDDGSVDECLPANLSIRQFEIVEGPQVLCAFADPNKTIESVSLVDATDRGGFAVGGITCRTGGEVLWSQFDESTTSPAHPHWSKPAPTGTLQIEPRAGDDRPIHAGYGSGRDVVGSMHGNSLRRLIHEDDSPYAFFTFTLDGKTLDRDKFGPAKVVPLHATGRPALVSVVYNVLPCPGVQFHLLAEVVNGVELRFRGALVNKGEGTYRLGLTCPRVRPYVLRSNPAEAEYVFPCRGAVIGRENVSLSTRYGGLFGVQFMAMTNAGSVFYVRTEDTTCIERNYELAKDDDGVTMGIRYPERPLAPGQTRELADTIIAARDGDWHVAFDAYRAWLRTWYKPVSPRKPWFREVFNFRQRFLHWLDPLYDDKTGRIDLPRALAEAREQFGGIEYMHLFDWGNCGPYGRIYGRIGDYDPYEYIKGGLGNLHKVIADVRRGGTPVGLYIEGYLLDERGKLGKKHGPEWQMRGPNGAAYRWPDSTELYICPGVQTWRDVQAATYAAKVRELDVDGMYIDQFGFTGTDKDCYSDRHGHSIPSYPVLTELETTKAIRRSVDSVKPGVAIYTEESPCDVTSQYQDGSFTYAMSECRGRGATIPLNLFRFAVPDFKTFEILVCDKPTASWATGVRWTFFNGEGIWLEGPANEWFTPETLATIRRCHAILRKHRDAFTSNDPRPLVPTLADGVFANYFPAESGEVWTLYNSRHRTIRGELLKVAHRPGRTWHDAWHDRPAGFRCDGDSDVVSTEVGPQGVGCLVRLHLASGTR